MRKADNLPPSCAVAKKSGSLNFLEPSGPVTGLLYLYLVDNLILSGVEVVSELILLLRLQMVLGSVVRKIV